MTPRWCALAILLSIGAAELFAGVPSRRFLSAYEARRDFLGSPGPAFRADTIPLQQIVLPDGGGRKSVGMAVIYSLLLPGMGELYAGSFQSGRYFLAAEGGLWLTYVGFNTYGNSLRDDGRQFAAAHAGLNPSGKSDQYFVDVGNFFNVDQYNEKKLRDRTPERLYDPAAGFAWQWDTDANRATFRDQRVRSDLVFNNMRFVVAAIIVNHVVSAINAARSAIAHNNAQSDPMGDLQIGAEVLGGITRPHGVMITVAKGL